jgi:hypothetical protein
MVNVITRRTSSGLGRIALGLWLAIFGLSSLLETSIPNRDDILAVLAVAAGALLLFATNRRRLSKSLGIVLVSIWLIGFGVLHLVEVDSPNSAAALDAIAMTAGIVLLAGLSERRLTEKLSMLLLSIWLVVLRLTGLTDLSFSNLETVLPLLAAAGGILILLNR